MFKYSLVLLLIISAMHVNAQLFSGRVVEADGQKGIAFAKVTLVDFQHGALTDESGYFKIPGKFPEKLHLRVSAYGYETIELEVSSTDTVRISLAQTHLEVDEVEVTASRNELKRNSVTYVELRSIDELTEVPVTGLGQALEAIPGVYNSSTGNGISKPVIRGLQGTRVVSLLNGVRIENQQWGGDHGMGLSELGIGSVEVLKGPASLLYGADALGGVIYYADEGYAVHGKQELTLSSQFESNSLGTTNTAFYKGSVGGLKLMAGARYASHADYTLSSGLFVKNSRYQDVAARFGAGWSRGKWVASLKYSYSRSALGIPGHTHDSVISPDLFKSEKQVRKSTLPLQHFVNHIASFENKLLYGKHSVQLLVAFTSNELTEFEEKVTIPGLRMILNNVPYKLNVSSRIGTGWKLNYGIQGMFQWQHNDPKAEELLLPNSQQLDNGIYAVLDWERGKWKTQAGVRADFRQLNADAHPGHFPNAFSGSYTGYNFAIGTNYTPSRRHIMRLNLSSGFRIPHLTELLSNGVHHGTFRYEVGTSNLRSEQAIQLDASYEFTGEHLSLVVNPFVNVIENYIYAAAQDSFIDGYQVFRYEQQNQVLLAGADAGFHWHPHFAHFLHLESSFSYLGFQSGNNAITLIPQPRVNTTASIRFGMKSAIKLEDIVFQYNYFLPQTDVGPFEKPSADYGLLNIGVRIGWDGKVPATLQLGVRNALNTNYTNHLSRLKNIGLENPGRNLYVKLLFKFNYHEKK